MFLQIIETREWSFKIILPIPKIQRLRGIKTDKKTKENDYKNLTLHIRNLRQRVTKMKKIFLKKPFPVKD